VSAIAGCRAAAAAPAAGCRNLPTARFQPDGTGRMMLETLQIFGLGRNFINGLTPVRGILR
jgi:hypothetical protein